jgi:UDP-glucose 4-epimerase
LPTNPYGESKLAVEQLLKDCARNGSLQYVSLRYFNAAGADASGQLGERHNPETHLIPLVLRVATGELEQIRIYGADYPTPDGTCLRDYVHVSDLTQAHLLALQSLQKGAASAVYNLGNSKGYSVREVIESARSLTGHSIPAVVSERRAGDPAVLVANSEKIRRELNWKPRYEDLSEIIKTAWAWAQKEAERKK